jgi:hypothetical protein
MYARQIWIELDCHAEVADRTVLVALCRPCDTARVIRFGEVRWIKLTELDCPRAELDRELTVADIIAALRNTRRGLWCISSVGRLTEGDRDTERCGT